MAALPTQIVPLPLAGGLDESKDPTAAEPGSLLVLQNLIYQQAGALVRRPGSEAMAVDGTDGVQLPDVDWLGTRGQELLAIGERPQISLSGVPVDLGPYLWSWSEALEQWAPRSQVPPATWTAEPAVTVSETIPIEAVCYICHAGGLEVKLWGVDGSGGTVALRCRAIDQETGAVVLKDTAVGSINSRFVAFAVGTKVAVVYFDSFFSFKVSYLDTSTLAWSGFSTFYSTAGNVAAQFWDCCPIDSTHFALVCTITGNGLWLVRATVGAGTTDTNLFANAGHCTVASDGSSIATVAVNLTAGRMDAWTNNATSLAAGAIAGVEIMGNPTLDFLDRLSCCLDNLGRVWAVADTRKTIAGPVQMSRMAVAALDSAGASYSPVRYAYWISQGARPFAVGERVYLPVVPSTYNKERDFLWGLALLDLTTHPEDSTRDRPFALVGLLPSLRHQFWWTDVWRQVPFVSEQDSSTWVFPMEVAVGNQDEINRHFDRGVLTFGASQSGLWRSAPALGGLCLSGAVTSWYDGHAACELGFAHRPAVYSVTPTEPAATAGANASYNYAVTWVWTDGAGLEHESEPSAVQTVTMADDEIGVGGALVTILIHPLQITRKGDLQDGRVRRPFARLYRTIDSDPTVYYLCADLTAVSDPSAASLTFTDEETDADLVEAARGILYTVGGRLEHQAPPPSSAVVQAKRRLWLASSVAPEVWFSGELLPGEGPWFHALQTLRLEGEEPITALASLDDRVVIFTARSIYVVSGEGPNDKGEGAFLGPQLVTSSAGCLDARSVVAWKGGVFFQSAEGLALLDRGLQVVYAGAAVQTQLAAYPELSGATLDAANERIHWLMSNSAGTAGGGLWFDYGQGAWGTFRYDDESGDQVVQLAQTLHQGRLVRSHGGLPLRSLEGEALDAGVWITAKIRTPYLQFASLSGAQRVRRFVVSGWAFDEADWVFRSYFDEATTAAQETTLPESVHGARESKIVVHLEQQRGSSVSLELEESPPDPIPGSIGALRITGLGVEVGVLPGVARVIPSRRR